jgi:hypothetical protein
MRLLPFPARADRVVDGPSTPIERGRWPIDLNPRGRASDSPKDLLRPTDCSEVGRRRSGGFITRGSRRQRLLPSQSARRTADSNEIRMARAITSAGNSAWLRPLSAYPSLYAPWESAAPFAVGRRGRLSLPDRSSGDLANDCNVVPRRRSRRAITPRGRPARVEEYGQAAQLPRKRYGAAHRGRPVVRCQACRQGRCGRVARPFGQSGRTCSACGPLAP